jgi:phage baseplate assembly protein V
MWNKVESYINRAIARIRLPFRGVIGSVDSSGGVQLVNGTGLNGEVLEGAEYFQHYGFTSNPPSGAMKVLAPVGGRTAHSIIVATEHPAYRIKALQSGELAIYTDEGDSIIMNRGRVINVTTQTLNVDASTAVNITTPTYTVNASQAVNLNTPQVSASENLSVAGVTAANGGMKAQSGANGGHAVDISGTASVSDDVVIGGKSQIGHTHIDSKGGQTSAEQ